MVFSQLLQILLRSYAKGAAMFKKILLTIMLVLAAVPCFGYGEDAVQAGPRPFYEQASDPTTSANIGWVYTKEVLGATELHFKDDAGNVIQFTAGGALKQFWTDGGTYIDPFDARRVRTGSVELWPNGDIIQSNFILSRASVSLSDDAYIDIAAGSTGFGELIVGDNEERARFSWTTGGVVTLMENTANVALSDTDGKFCIFNNGTSVRIRNRLGSPKTVKYVLNI